MILFDLRAVPRASDVVFELVGVDEDQRWQERDEHDQREVKESEQRVYFENTVDKAKGHHQSSWVVPESQLVLHQMSENWDESKNAQRDV